MRTTCFHCLFLLTVAFPPTYSIAQTDAGKTYPTVGSIERLDPALDQLIDRGAKIEVLADGFIWSEGPVWIKKGNYLLFSDIPNNRIVKWSEAGGATTYLKPSGYTGSDRREGEPGSNGLLLDPQGRLFGGQTMPLMRHLIQQSEMSRADIEELRRLIDRLKEANADD